MSGNGLPTSQVIMSADIAGSTALYEQVGDVQAQALVADCLKTVKALSDEHHGRVLAEVGDQIVALFEDAAAAASEIHAEMHERNARESGPRIRMRIGMHCGPLVSDADALAGETAKIAHWAGSHAKPEQNPRHQGHHRSTAAHVSRGVALR